MNYATIVHEMYDDFGDGLGVEQTPTVPPVPMDQELWAFDKKAKDANRLPARVFAKWFAAEVIGDQTTAKFSALNVIRCRSPLRCGETMNSATVYAPNAKLTIASIAKPHRVANSASRLRSVLN